MATPYFVADSASVTIMRSLASSSYGSYSLNLPDGIELEDVHDFDVPGNELGYVAHVGHGRRVGGLARRFVRADVNVTAADPSDPDRFPDSDVDRVLRDVAKRVSGDFFLESDVSKAGLGPWVPHVDFKVGDLARVEIWGQVVVLPVTRIEEVVSDHDIVDWRVHVGGQLVSDEEARKAENLALHRAFLQDRRELAGVEGIASQAARTAGEAQTAAEGAQKSTDGLTEDLTGDVETPVPEAVERRTGALGGVKRDLDQAQSEQIILHDNQLKWLRWTKTQFNFGFSRASGEDYNVSDTVETGLVDAVVNEFDGKGVRWIVRPGWKGTYRVEAMFEDGTESTIHGRALGQANAFSTQSDLDKTAVRASVQVWPDHGVEPREWAVQVQRSPGGQPQFITPGGLGAEDISLSGEGLISFSVPVRADHSVRHLGVYPLESGQLISRGVQVAPALNEASGVVIFTEVMPQLQWDIGIPLRGDFTGQIASRIVPWSIRLGAWNYATVGTWTAPAWDQPVRATISYSIRWAEISAWSVAEYRTRVQVNGSTVDWIGRSTVGGMNSLFRRSVDVTLRAGDRIAIGAAAQDNEDRRRRMSGSFTVTWRPL